MGAGIAGGDWEQKYAAVRDFAAANPWLRVVLVRRPQRCARCRKPLAADRGGSGQLERKARFAKGRGDGWFWGFRASPYADPEQERAPTTLPWACGDSPAVQKLEAALGAGVAEYVSKVWHVGRVRGGEWEKERLLGGRAGQAKDDRCLSATIWLSLAEWRTSPERPFVHALLVHRDRVANLSGAPTGGCCLPKPYNKEPLTGVEWRRAIFETLDASGEPPGTKEEGWTSWRQLFEYAVQGNQEWGLKLGEVVADRADRWEIRTLSEKLQARVRLEQSMPHCRGCRQDNEDNALDEFERTEQKDSRTHGPLDAPIAG